METMENKILRSIIDTPKFVPRAIIQNDVSLPTARDKIAAQAVKY